MDLRPYQLEAVEAVREHIRAGKKKVLLICPTGGGKTVVFSHIVERAAERGSRALILAHRRELVSQASQKLAAFGVSHGIIQAGFRPAPQRPVQVASVQTLARRSSSATRVDIIVVDESHHVTTENGYANILKRYPEAFVLGVTATPWRLDGRGLADVFDAHVVARTPRELRDDGFLTPVGGWEYEGIDTSAARVQRGDYVVGDLQASASSQRVVGDIVGEWLRHAGGVRTVLFALNVEHSQLMTEAFRQAGVAAEHVDGEMPAAERDAVLARFRAGTTTVVCNCNVLTEGWDCPEAECCILARPTLSTALYLQMVGRVLRPAPGKAKARIHDHAGCLAAHGHPFAERDYSPEVTARADRKDTEKKKKEAKRCPACNSIRVRWPCDACGHRPTPQELKLEAEAAVAMEIQNDATAARKSDRMPDAVRRQQWQASFAPDEQKRFNFFARMAQKHGAVKGARVYFWFSGMTEHPKREWVAAARSEEAAASRLGGF